MTRVNPQVKLHLLAGVWQVLAYVNAGESCLTTIWREAARSESCKKMKALIGYTANHGPPSDNRDKCRFLEDGLFEMKVGPKKGAKFRVVFFYDAGQTVVLTNSFSKSQRKAPTSEIERAKRRRAEYNAAKDLDRLKLVPLEEELNRGR